MDATQRATFDFQGSVVLVTGAGSGIGRAVARAFDDAGATVVLTGRRLEPLQDEASASCSGRVHAVRADVSRLEEVQRLVSEIVADHGRLDVVVSNAGKYVGGTIDQVAQSEWRAMLETNVEGLFNVAKASFAELARTQGSLVAVSSVSGLRGDWGQVAYNATKGAVTQLVLSLALDWGAAGVRVNAIAPSLTDTPATHDFVADRAMAEQFEARTALGRLAEPEDMAPAVLFLASREASYITGAVVPVDGGTSASSGQAHLSTSPTG